MITKGHDSINYDRIYLKTSCKNNDAIDICDMVLKCMCMMMLIVNCIVNDGMALISMYVVVSLVIMISLPLKVLCYDKFYFYENGIWFEPAMSFNNMMKVDVQTMIQVPSEEGPLFVIQEHGVKSPTCAMWRIDDTNYLTYLTPAASSYIMREYKKNAE